MRKVGFYISIILIGVFIFVKCSDNQSINTETEKTFADFKQSLATDPLFSNVLKSAEDLGDYVSDPQTSINTDVSLVELNKSLANTNKHDVQMDILSNLTNRPAEFIRLIEKKYEYQQKFIANNPGFIKLSQEQQNELINFVVEKKLSSTEKKASSNLSDKCKDQYDSDISYCHKKQYAGAAVCGLALPTLLGALGCGAAVIVDAAICHDQAESDYAICSGIV